jgi:hypothetical protein
MVARVTEGFRSTGHAYRAGLVIVEIVERSSKHSRRVNLEQCLLNWINLFDEAQVHRCNTGLSMLEGRTKHLVRNQVGTRASGCVGGPQHASLLASNAKGKRGSEVRAAWPTVSCEPFSDAIGPTHVQVVQAFRKKVDASVGNLPGQGSESDWRHRDERIELWRQPVENLLKVVIHIVRRPLVRCYCHVESRDVFRR